MPRKRTAIVRILFGNPDYLGGRVEKILTEVAAAAQWRDLMPKTVAYVFGRENYNLVRNAGLTARLVDDRPVVTQDFSPWYHKPLGWRAAQSEFNTIVALDWDIRPLVPINQRRLFRNLAAKSFLQANLNRYMNIKARYRRRMAGSIRPVSTRMIPSAAFVYLRGADGRHAVERILEIMEASAGASEEQAMAQFVDQLYGGWKGVEHWSQYHEPFCCRLPRLREAVSDGGPPARKKVHWFTY